MVNYILFLTSCINMLAAVWSCECFQMLASMIWWRNSSAVPESNGRSSVRPAVPAGRPGHRFPATGFFAPSGKKRDGGGINGRSSGPAVPAGPVAVPAPGFVTPLVKKRDGGGIRPEISSEEMLRTNVAIFLMILHSDTLTRKWRATHLVTHIYTKYTKI